MAISLHLSILAYLDLSSLASNGTSLTKLKGLSHDRELSRSVG